jgi:hypothetical protein
MVFIPAPARAQGPEKYAGIAPLAEGACRPAAAAADGAKDRKGALVQGTQSNGGRPDRL